MKISGTAPPSQSTLRSTLESLAAALGVIAVTVFLFAPHLWALTEPTPGSFEWDRALGFLRQCNNPWDPDVEAALRWRLLPPTVAHWFGLTGKSALVLAWLGIVTLLAQVDWTLRGLGVARRARIATMFLVAGSGGLLTSMHWLGINDGWYLVGLVAVTLGRGWRSLVVPCLLCVWVDERFVVALPLAVICRTIRTADDAPAESVAGLLRRLAIVIWPCALALLPYGIVRISLSVGDEDLANGWFLRTIASEFVTWLSYAPLGWWMGLRAAWFPLFTGLRDVASARGMLSAALCAVAVCGTLSASIVLAADISRTAILLLPGVLCGSISLARTARGERALVVAAMAGLLLPAMHVSGTSAEPIHWLPREIWRLIHGF